MVQLSVKEYVQFEVVRGLFFLNDCFVKARVVEVELPEVRLRVKLPLPLFTTLEIIVASLPVLVVLFESLVLLSLHTVVSSVEFSLRALVVGFFLSLRGRLLFRLFLFFAGCIFRGLGIEIINTRMKRGGSREGGGGAYLFGFVSVSLGLFLGCFESESVIGFVRVVVFIVDPALSVFSVCHLSK